MSTTNEYYYIWRAMSFTIFLAFTIMSLVAFSTSYWRSYNDVYHGLWKACYIGPVVEFCDRIGHSSRYAGAPLEATRAMMILAEITYGATFVLYCLWMPQSRTHLRRHNAEKIALSTQLVALCGGIFNMIAVFVFGLYYTNNADVNALDWSFYLACAPAAGVILSSIATLVMIKIHCLKDMFSFRTRQENYGTSPNATANTNV